MSWKNSLVSALPVASYLVPSRTLSANVWTNPCMGNACLCLAWSRHYLIHTTGQQSYFQVLSGHASGYMDQSPNFQNSLQNRHLKLLNDSSCKAYWNDTIHTRFYWVVEKLLAFKDHFCTIGDSHHTTVQREKNHGVQECHRLAPHVRVLFPKFCNFRRLGTLLPRSIKIKGARLSNLPKCTGVPREVEHR